MFLIGWIIVFATSASRLVVYDYPLTLPTILLVLISIFAFVLGARAAPRYPDVEDGDPRRSLDDFDRLTLTVLCLLSSLAAFYVLRDLSAGGLHRLTNFSTEAAGIRKDMWTAFSAGEVEISPIRSMALTSSLIIATLLPWAAKYSVRALKYAAALSAITVILSSFLVAGRALASVLVICLLVSWSLTYGTASMRRLFSVRRVVALFVVGYYFFVVFPSQRNSTLAGKYIDLSLWFRANARFPDWVNSAASDHDMEWVKMFANSAEYFSSPLYNLNYFVTQTDVFSWYKLGLYNLTQVSQVSGAIGKDVTPWQQIRFDIAAVLSSVGRSTNPWSTGIRDLGIDFGLLLIPVLGILGFIAQAIYEKSTKYGSYIGLVAGTYVSVSCAIFAFISPFQIRILGNGFWLIGIIALLHYLIGRRTEAKPAYTPTRGQNTGARPAHPVSPRR
jgi:hypothetical protein